MRASAWGSTGRWWVRYLFYMRNALLGDFGRSMVNSKPVIEDIRKFWPASVELALAAIAISARQSASRSAWSRPCGPAAGSTG